MKKSYQERERVSCRENILAKHLGKDDFNTQDTLVFRELLKLHTKNKPGWGMDIGLNGYFFKEDAEVITTAMRSCPEKNA